jgi:hypothetical protein
MAPGMIIMHGIFRCNTLLQKLDQIDWKGDDEIVKG